MAKKYIITEEDLGKVQNFLGEIPLKWAEPLKVFLFNNKVLVEFNEEQPETIEENKE